MVIRIEYGAQYPEQLIAGSKFTTDGPMDRSDAEGIVRYVNRRAIKAGIEERALLVERNVIVGEWAPSNTGVVPPHITERIGDGTDGEGPGQGEDDRDGRHGDGQEGADDRRPPG